MTKGFLVFKGALVIPKLKSYFEKRGLVSNELSPSSGDK